MRATIEDVAREAKVHRSTVSRVFTGSGPVSPENRERVLAAAKRLGYHPNTLAGALKSRKRNTFGLLSFWYFAPNALDPYYSRLLGGFLDAAGKLGHRVLLRNVIGRFDQNEECLRFCHDAQLAGVVVVAPRTHESALAELARVPVPVVLVAYRPQQPALSFIDLDNVEATRLAVRHLVALGHARIAFVGGEHQLSANARDRYEGYLAGMREAGKKLDKRLVHQREFTPAFAAEAFGELFALPAASRPTAVVCATDTMAVAVAGAAKRLGLSVPGDLSITGIDDNPEAIAALPSLTTVPFPFYEVGVQAGELLRQLGADPHSGPRRVLLEPRLVVRGSTGAPR